MIIQRLSSIVSISHPHLASITYTNKNMYGDEDGDVDDVDGDDNDYVDDGDEEEDNAKYNDALPLINLFLPGTSIHTYTSRLKH